MKPFLDWVKPGSEAAEIARRIDPNRIPRHIAIIMDGNGRWARRRHLPRVAGHRNGVTAVRETVEACARLGVETLTLYAFSVENWKRPQSEIDTLFALMRDYLDKELEQLKRDSVRVQAIGRIHELPADIQEKLDIAMVESAANDGLLVNVALNYGGRAEIVDAVNALLRQAKQTGDFGPISEDDLSGQLYTAAVPDPDLLIRTSGELRVSNFLLWQIAYAELWVTERLWPDFRAADLAEAIVAYQQRDRRYGGVNASEPALVGAAESAAADEAGKPL